MTPLRRTIEHIALNEDLGLREQDPATPYGDILDRLTGLTSITTAAVALDRTPVEIAARVHGYATRRTHWASNRRLKPKA